MIAGYETHEYAIPVAGQVIRLLGPRDPYTPHNDAERQAYYAQAGYKPFWTEPWVAAVMLAEHVLASVAPGPPVLELGAGLGLVGLALSRAGHRVVITDCDEDALAFVRASAQLNDISVHEVRRLDWRQPPATTYATIVGSEIIYAPEIHAPVAELLARCLEPGGSAYLSDLNRNGAAAFPAAVRAVGLDCQTCRATAPAIPGPDSVDYRVFIGNVLRVRRA